jgi:DNA repair exonuclease SbcCD ATPase subunit
MVSALFLAAALGSGDPALGPIRAELSDLANRIEHLKVRRIHGDDVGRDLERLLVRAQELAAEIERREAALEAAPAEVVPTAAELRERADALQDEADALAAAANALDIRIENARRAVGPGAGMARASVAEGGNVAELERLQALLTERSRVASQLGAVRAELAAVEAAARRAAAEEGYEQRLEGGADPRR